MKSFGVTRLNKTQYNELTNAIKLTFRNLLENGYYDSSENIYYYNLAVIPSYRNKENFGDCDLLSDMPTSLFEKELTNNKDFTILGKKSNGNVKSYAVKFKNFKPFQIDLIKTNSYNFDFNLKYLSYNDLGNLIGRIAAALSFKFAHDGLYIQTWFSHNGTLKNIERVKENGKTNEHAEYKKEYLFLNDFQKAIEFLGFDYERFCKGFNELDDIIKYVANSKYFCKDFFALENRNHIQRMRDKKRTTYHAALEYFKNLENRDRSIIKAEFKKAINSQFPQIATIKHKMKKECKRRYIISRRLKATRIQWLAKKHFGATLEGITLGNMMRAIILLENDLIIDTNQTTQIEMLKFEIVFSLLNQTKVSLRFKKPLNEENYIFSKAIQFILLEKISGNNIFYEDDLTDLDDLVEYVTLDPSFKGLIKRIYYRNESNYNPPRLNKIMNWVNPTMLALTKEIMDEIEMIPFEDKKQIKDICDILLQNSPIRHHCKR